MTVKELIEKLHSIDSEINYGAHPKLCEDNFRICDEDYNEFEIVDFEPCMTGGCGCWYGLSLIVKPVKDD